MAKLTSKGRAAIPASKFAGPGRSFPVENKSHAKAALSGASRALNVGNITSAQKSTIDARARAVLGKKK